MAQLHEIVPFATRCLYMRVNMPTNDTSFFLDVRGAQKRQQRLRH
jgi:hypothetical protein